MQSIEDQTQVRSSSLFSELGEEDFKLLFEEFQSVDYDRGESLFSEGEARTKLFIVLEGRVDLMVADLTKEPRRIMSYDRGKMIGEGVLLEQTIHATTAHCAEKVRVAEMDREGLGRIFKKRPALEAKVLRGFVGDVVGRMDQIRHQFGPESFKFASGRTRSEHDLLGDLDVPAEAYYGIQTARALDNFAITGIPIQRYEHLIRALAMVKLAAARANEDCDNLPSDRADAIATACFEIVRGRLHDNFAVDILQGGAGTSTNMNANEVIANRALELMGHEKGDYDHCHPNNDVNRAQSTNDVYPTALKIAMANGAQKLVPALQALTASFRERGAKFAHVVKMGRTQLQDAVPMTLGQEFNAYAASLAQEVDGLESAVDGLLEINMGGTAIGTGLNAPKGYAARALAHLQKTTALDLRLADDLIEATQDTQAFVVFSSALKSLAVKLSKVASDLRLLSSGPRAGFNEIHLPARQPGSSIMPGKVNPVIPEVVNQVAYRVIGNDLTVTLAAEAGQLELNVMEPVLAASILDSVEILTHAAETFRINCVEGIEANEDQCREFVERSIGVVTALVPVLGYEVSTQLAAEALRDGRGIVELVRERGLLDEERIAEVLSPENMTGGA